MGEKTPAMTKRALAFTKKAAAIGIPISSGFTSPSSNHILFTFSNGMDYALVYCTAFGLFTIWVEAVDDKPQTSFTTIVRPTAFLRGIKKKGFVDVSDNPPSLPPHTTPYKDL